MSTDDSATPQRDCYPFALGKRPDSRAHLSTSGQFHAGRPPTVQRGSGITPRCRQMSTVGRFTLSRSATSWMPTGSQLLMDETVEKVLTPGKVCVDNLYMHSNFVATNFSIEQVWGGPCDHHNCEGDCVAFITINFTDGGSVGGYFCRHHLNTYEAAYGLPRSAAA